MNAPKGEKFFNPEETAMLEKTATVPTPDVQTEETIGMSEEMRQAKEAADAARLQAQIERDYANEQAMRKAQEAAEAAFDGDAGEERKAA